MPVQENLTALKAWLQSSMKQILNPLRCCPFNSTLSASPDYKFSSLKLVILYYTHIIVPLTDFQSSVKSLTEIREAAK